MARVLIAYGTRQGKTAEIADRIARVLEADGNKVTTVDLRSRHDVSPVGSDAVLVGASMHATNYEREVKRWVAQWRDELGARPNAFFSVSLSAADDDERHVAQVREVVDQFVESTGWKPDRVETIAGALAYSKYNPLVRWMVKRIARKEQGDRYADTSRDYDFTDYAQVDRFASDFASVVSALTQVARAADERADGTTLS